MLDPDRTEDRLAAPVHEFIFKVASRCNLNCDYCYEYHHGDESWKYASKFMAPAVYETAAYRIVAHARHHGLESISISLHGGEPLLLGTKRLTELAGTVRRIIGESGIQLSLGIQTNAVLLNEAYADVIREHDIFIGVSLDGSRATNDLHRVDHRGRGSYDKVIEGIRILQRCAPRHLTGLLAVIEVHSDPLETLDALAELGVPHIDFLLPHHNWDRPPVREVRGEVDPYGRWLAQIWDAWIGGRHSHLRIRFLDNIVARLVGHPGLYEQMTTAPVQLLTINPDGDFEGVDTLKSTGAGLQRTGLNIMDHEIDAVLTHPIYSMRQHWLASLPSACTDCEIRHICTAGYLPHRYRSGTEFNNPSVYCSDIKKIVSHVEKSLFSQLRNAP